MIRVTVTIAFLLVTAMLSAAGDYSRAVERFVRTCGVSSSSLAVKVVDLKTGDTLASHNTEASLIPASIMKSVTTASLLGIAGSEYRYHTRVYVDGPLDMGILRGNLIVEGSCDPSVNSEEEPSGTDIIAEITEIVRSMGINKIEGGIMADETSFRGFPRPESWLEADLRHSYGTGSHAFNFRNNASGDRAIENPFGVFRTQLTSALRRVGISVDGKKMGEGERIQVFDHLSPQIDEIMRSCMMRSDNLFAESMLRTYGKLSGGDGSTPDAANMELRHWEEKKMPMDGVEIVDGSGLSRLNRVTADFMSGVLGHMSGDATYASFFPLAGQEGTLKKFLAGTSLDSYIALKTGSMKGIQCYAGYKLDDDYAPTHSVVIIMNDINGSRAKAKKAAERMLLEIFDNSDHQQNNNN